MEATWAWIGQPHHAAGCNPAGLVPGVRDTGSPFAHQFGSGFAAPGQAAAGGEDAGGGVTPSAVSNRICWSGRGRSPFHTRAAVAVSGWQAGRCAGPGGCWHGCRVRDICRDKPHCHRTGQHCPGVPRPYRQAGTAGLARAVLPGGQAVLAYPANMHLVAGDRGTLTAAQLGTAGSYLTYLNVTPRQGAESLQDWLRFRVNHLLDEDASAARLLAARRGLRFAGATSSCVLDTYVTKVKANHYTELACFVQGRTSATVIVAAVPAAGWPRSSAVLARAISAYQA